MKRNPSIKHVALCWELGGGYGHLSSLAPFVCGLLERGCCIHLITRGICAFAKALSAGSQNGNERCNTFGVRHLSPGLTQGALADAHDPGL